MTELSKTLAALMQADEVPMSDAWGKLYDELARIDEGMGKTQPVSKRDELPANAQDTAPKTIPIAVAWCLDDRKEDQSATTYDYEIACRWLEKGWTVTPLFEFVQEPPKEKPEGLASLMGRVRRTVDVNRLRGLYSPREVEDLSNGQ